ncbi:MAG: hypothetical protein FJ006_10790 [Chloroflexi bacterium]|nr:hypothetical protein [Chloroflexota bacterium]
MRSMRKWISSGIMLVILGGLFTTTACANKVVGYCQKNNLSTELIELLKPLGSDGINDNEKILIDEIALLTSQLQADSKTLYVLGTIVNDGKVTEDEISNFSDFDGDGLKNSEEIVTYRTDPWLADSDRDRLKDGDEVLTYRTDPLRADSDNDGFDDGAEVLTLKTDPLNPSFDYNVDTIITDYEQIKPIVEKIAKDLNIAETLSKVTFNLISNSEFRARWANLQFEQVWEQDPTWGAWIWNCSTDMS